MSQSCGKLIQHLGFLIHGSLTECTAGAGTSRSVTDERNQSVSIGISDGHLVLLAAGVASLAVCRRLGWLWYAWDRRSVAEVTALVFAASKGAIVCLRAHPAGSVLVRRNP